MTKSDLEQSLASALGALMCIRGGSTNPIEISNMAINMNLDAIDYLDEKAGKNQ